jgi:hypothetical protein
VGTWETTPYVVGGNIILYADEFEFGQMQCMLYIGSEECEVEKKDQNGRGRWN